MIAVLWMSSTASIKFPNHVIHSVCAATYSS